MSTNNTGTSGIDRIHGSDGAHLLELLALLGDPIDRRLLAYIAYDNPEDVEDIPAHTGAEEYLDDETRDEFLASLRENHLPTLEDTGLIDWDRKRDVVTRGERFDELWPVLRLMITHREELPDEWLSFAEFDEFEASEEPDDD